MINDLYKVFIAGFFFVLGDYVTVARLAEAIKKMIIHFKQIM